MEYPFESLDPERFQHFCQALIAREFKEVQCFPVGQPDGGRDALSYYTERTGREFIMYQIKFVRNPLAEKDPHQWLTKILEDEAPKFKKQMPRGAQKYILITNVAGTAHPDVGSIDKTNKILNDQLGVPSMCWWRDDLSRRLDNAWDLKWIYSELMTGPDLIRAVMEQGLSEKREKRASAIRAFVKDQFDKDQDVRFKQVDLQNKLIDLFIDVPIAFPQSIPTRRGKFNKHHEFRRIIHQLISISSVNTEIDFSVEDYSSASIDVTREYLLGRDEQIVIGSASLILHPLAQKNIPRMVLEGAPGQGKSTITQYISQVHRMKVLKKNELIQQLPTDHRNAPARLPFKVDLRDLSGWLSRRNPFSPDDEESLPPYWQKSLESFLAAQVRYHSGGIEFDVDDFIAIVRVSSILLVFDGLDEVADISRRREVVDEIIRGVSRLEENAASIQVIVTSRPAAFANSPGLPEEDFPYFHLGFVTRNLIDQYAEKWLRARKLYGKEASDVKKILKEKLSQPHLRDLARNTMQLTILLSLIHTRGSSLPDKRTALYDSYVELFFNRESEKSIIVRDYRDLLVNIHRYLAWILHSESEQGGNNGSISEERLHSLLTDFLAQEGYDISIAKSLFTGMVERVVALVSRVEGTYEFEVQPLREYFAARYLYETAPYSPPGNERKGTKPDRFDAIARNFYWLNVTRFYAGCYSKGELSSLIDRLQELVNDAAYKFINHPRNLATMLLADWVFAQHPKSVQQVVELILDGIGLHYVAMLSGRRTPSGNSLVLPKQSGRDELIARCFSILNTAPPRDFASSVMDLIKSNASIQEITDYWQVSALRQSNSCKTQWLGHGLNLGILQKIALSELKSFISDDPFNAARINILFRARRFDYIESSEEMFNATIEAILDRDIVPFQHQRAQSVYELLAQSIDGHRYAVAFHNPQSIPLKSLREMEMRRLHIDFDQEFKYKWPIYEITEKIEHVLKNFEAVSEYPAQEWATEIRPWDSIVEPVRQLWGERWSLYHLANISAGIKSSIDTCKDYSELFDYNISLCRRARYARLRAGTVAWWQRQQLNVENSNDLMFYILLLVTWASPATISHISEYIDENITTLSNDQWSKLYSAVQDARAVNRDQQGTRPVNFNTILSVRNDRTLSLLSLRLREENKNDLFTKRLSNYKGDDLFTLRLAQKLAIDSLNSENADWPNALDIISRSYKRGVISDPYTLQQFTRKQSHTFLPTDVAREILSNPEDFPGFLVIIAESYYKNIVSSHIIPVAEVSRDEKWFDN